MVGPRQVVDRSVAERSLAFPSSGASDVNSLAEERDRPKREQTSFAAHNGNVPIRREYRATVGNEERQSSVSLRVFTEREAEGS